jgi:hypothetical protein
MLPDSGLPPVTRRCVGPGVPSDTISESRASPIRDSISRLRFWWIWYLFEKGSREIIICILI